MKNNDNAIIDETIFVEGCFIGLISIFKDITLLRTSVGDLLRYHSAQES
jgi:hypothetical protein